MTRSDSWQVRCKLCDKVAEPTGRGTVDIDHDLKKHEQYASHRMNQTAVEDGHSRSPESSRSGASD